MTKKGGSSEPPRTPPAYGPVMLPGSCYFYGIEQVSSIHDIAESCFCVYYHTCTCPHYACLSGWNNSNSSQAIHFIVTIDSYSSIEIHKFFTGGLYSREKTRGSLNDMNHVYYIIECSCTYFWTQFGSATNSVENGTINKVYIQCHYIIEQHLY